MNLWEKDKVPFYDETLMDGFVPTLTPYIADGAKTCIVVIPGGGYTHRARIHEGEQIAEWFNSIGMSAFILDYRHSPYRHPVPVTDGRRGVRLARSLSKEYGYEKVGIMGFSAGGHLAGSVGTFKGDFGYEPQDEIDKESSKPDFMILCYPVISFAEYAHRGSFENLSDDLKPQTAVELSIDKNVDSNTPPTFLFHAVGDISVPVENSLLMASALSRYKVPFELHTFADGGHGVGLANGNKPACYLEYTKFWTENLKNWLKSIGC